MIKPALAVVAICAALAATIVTAASGPMMATPEALALTPVARLTEGLPTLSGAPGVAISRAANGLAEDCVVETRGEARTLTCGR